MTVPRPRPSPAPRLRDIAEENTILQKARHPYIVRLHHAFQDSSHFYLLLSYCGGGDLYAYLTARDKLTEHGAQIILGEVALALQYLHEEHSVVYRDLKPENVLLGLDGHAVLSDSAPPSGSRVASARRRTAGRAACRRRRR